MILVTSLRRTGFIHSLSGWNLYLKCLLPRNLALRVAFVLDVFLQKKGNVVDLITFVLTVVELTSFLRALVLLLNLRALLNLRTLTRSLCLREFGEFQYYI